ncbi:MAG TPA: hypothetical protein DCY79_09725 [Planctomycetaceae bacterium]|nr:hypothetical protein [Blastopirellula sp.]HAY80068.1 hypothetical protein [Planctomycetaceae bacterium]
MKFALLGSDDATLRLVQAIAADSAHEVVAVYGAEQHQRTLFDLAPGASFDTDWEPVIHEPVADAIIVARQTPWEDRNDVLRKLFQCDLPLLIVHPACEAIVAFELEMIREDRQGLVLPFVPGQHSAAYRTATQLVSGQQTALGELKQVVVERTMATTSRPVVLDQVAHDVSLMRPFLKTVRRVSAMAPNADATTLADLTVNMTGESGLLGRWNVSHAGQHETAQLKLVGAAATAVLNISADPDQWSLTVEGQSQATETDDPVPDASAMLQAFAQLVEKPTADTAWMAASRDIEVADTVEHSLRRGKTLELHQEQLSEENTFKGMMAAGGCFLLLITLAILVVGSVFEGVQRPLSYRPSEADQTSDTSPDEPADATADAKRPGRALWIRLWPAYPFAIFLALQGFRLVFIAPRATSDKR